MFNNSFEMYNSSILICILLIYRCVCGVACSGGISTGALYFIATSARHNRILMRLVGRVPKRRYNRYKIHTYYINTHIDTRTTQTKCCEIRRYNRGFAFQKKATSRLFPPSLAPFHLPRSARLMICENSLPTSCIVLIYGTVVVFLARQTNYETLSDSALKLASHSLR